MSSQDAPRDYGLAPTPQHAAERGALVVRDLRKRLGGRWVVNGVNLTIGRGEIVGLLGPNGAGKTVTFSMISGLLRPDGGHIELDGKDITVCRCTCARAAAAPICRRSDPSFAA